MSIYENSCSQPSPEYAEAKLIMKTKALTINFKEKPEDLEEIMGNLPAFQK